MRLDHLLSKEPLVAFRATQLRGSLANQPLGAISLSGGPHRSATRPEAAMTVSGDARWRVGHIVQL